MAHPVAPSLRDTQQAHAALRQHGEIPQGRLSPVIEASWRRCLDAGLHWQGRPDIEPVRRDTLDLMRDRNSQLMAHALPVMETLYQQIANTQSMVVLSDAGGYVLHSLGDAEFLGRAERVALAPGVDWSEPAKGTNAIGTALAEQAPVVVHGPQHYLLANHFLTCSAAPITDAYGRLVGALDVTGDWRSFSPHTLALVNMSVQMIENHLFGHTFADLAVLRFHARPEFLGTLCEGLAAFSPEGRVVSVNRSGCFQLGLPREALQGLGFEALFGMPFAAARSQLARALHPFPLLLHSGVRVFARLEVRVPERVAMPAVTRAGGRPAEAAPFVAQDAELVRRIEQGTRALEKGMPLLIQGETGSGKAALAHYLHRRHFHGLQWCEIACGTVSGDEFAAAIAHALGRPRRPGARPAFLFLRDVDLLPPPQQARLVAALRSDRPFAHFGAVLPVVVSSTRARLKEQAEAGQFRDDLYFHLGAASIALPPLRRRGDLWALATQLAAQAGSGELDASLRALFEAHPWPGNVRQLRNVLQAAAAQLDGESVLRPCHLSEEFLAEARAAAKPGTESADLATITRQAIVAALRGHDGNVSAAARSLGISRSTLYRRLRDEDGPA
ncbi:MAG: GAF domain-containing protein [Pseudomonadota bacterium]|jgi:transcriptional regulator of acetoin/glycerol metabolism